ncbi:SNF2 family N-terminal domain-containing protein [Mortierella sp. GBAus27b]|nr:SNF2 family N-terminal domain-containing protein [Mortierella sp. GBAus27b]
MAPAAGSSHQYTILATQPAAGSGSQSQPQKTVDLTQPVIDLTQQHQVENSSLYWSHDDDDDEDDDEENDEELLKALQKWEQPSYTNTSHSWGQDSTRNMEPGQSEKELRDLLANIQASEEDVAPQDRTGTPEGMASHILLLEHQKIGLTWLQKMEDGTNRGGILGDDMGLGKTVQTIALIASRPSPPIDDPVMWDNSQVFHSPPAEALLVKTKATLVVAPVSLVYQWAEELRTKTQPGLLKVYVYHGNNKSSNPEHLRRYDVVVTSVTTLTMDAGHVDAGNPRKSRTIGALFKAHFHRVVIDEAHVIKNRTTKSSKACALISATYRWCLTGTPVQNNVDELYSLIRVLRIKPYCDWDEFRNKISTPMKRTRQYGPAMQRVQALLKAVCLRRTKKCTVDGKPILDLPERNVHMVSTPFTDDERAFYTALEHRTRDRFNAYVRAGTVMKNYSNILVLLLRLRQACCHPHLINDFEKVQDTDAPAEEKARVDRLLDNLLDDIRRRLIERDADAVECPICMDVGEESVILSGCGHIYCRACITAHLSRHDDEDRKCPECRRPAPIDNLISVADFNARYCPVAEPEPEPEDVKGKGKALDDGDDANDLDKLPKIVVPDVLEDWLSSSKVDKLIEIVQAVTAKKEKIIVFSQFTSLLTLIERPLNAENIKYLRYDGSMSLDTRNDAVQRLIEDPDYSVMLISLKCGSLGLNLTVANHVVIMDPWWNPALENQAIDRVHRIGQTKDVHVHRLCIPETVEDRILALQARKQALADGALGEGKVPKLAKLGLQELMFLFRGA